MARIGKEALVLIVIGIVFVVPFIFIVLTAAKTRQEAALLQFSMPSSFQLLDNFREVLTFGNGRMARALWNSTVLTVASVTLIVLFSSLTAYVLQRRTDRFSSIVSAVLLAGLIIPPAVVPTIFLLQWLNVYKTLFGLIMVEVAFTVPFATLILLTALQSLDSEQLEAAEMDGAGWLSRFVHIMLPHLTRAITVVILIQTIFLLSTFAEILVTTNGGPGTSTETLSFYTYKWGFKFFQMGYASALAWVLFIVVGFAVALGATGTPSLFSRLDSGEIVVAGDQEEDVGGVVARVGDEVEAGLSGDAFASMVQGSVDAAGYLRLPRFTFEFESSLNDSLKAMGMTAKPTWVPKAIDAAAGQPTS